MSPNARHYLSLAAVHVRKAQACSDQGERRMRLSIAAFCIATARTARAN